MYHFDPANFNPAAFLAAFGIFIGIGVAVGFAILAVICYLVYKCYAAIPAKHRAMEPEKVWLLMIPCFGIVWNFFVFPGLSKSFKSYFDSVGDATVGDCYAQVALWYCVSSACCIIPCLNYIAGPASLVLFIVYLVKAYELKEKIKS